MTENATKHHAAAWTEVEYTAPCLSPYLATPIFIPKETNYYLCREDGSRKAARLSFVVFKKADASPDDEWEDDPTVGALLIDVLGDGDEEVEPVEAVYLGITPDKFVNVASEDEQTITFHIEWRYGEVTVDRATHTDEGWKIRKDDFDEQGIRCTLTPRRGTPFCVYLQIPYMEFTLTDNKGNKLTGNIEVHPHETDQYEYAFVGDETDDRFSLVLDDNRHTYLCILRDGNKLAVRDQRNKLAEVAEINATGKLTELLMGAHSALVKNKNRRWNIMLGISNDSEEQLSVDAVTLARLAYQRFTDSDDAEQTAQRLLLLESKYAFQWFWLHEDDWSHEHLKGLFDMEGIDTDQEKMMQQALLYNRYDQFMKHLCALSYVNKKPLQGDQLQARNNKRKIARCARTVKAHRDGETNIWEMTEDERKEIISLFTTFHREFTEQL